MVDLKDIKTGKATIVIFTGLNFFVPGGLGVFFLKHELFLSLDFAKLLLLSILISTPFILIAFVLSLLALETLLRVPSLGDRAEEKEIIENTEENDLTLVFLTNFFSVIIWIITLVSLWISDIQTDSMKIAEQIVKDYLSCSFILLLIALLMLAVKRYKLIRKS
jgi:hypothetical protein